MTTKFTLTTWQKIQATLLYHFASLDHLKELQRRVNELISFIDPTLDLSKAQNRDALLVNKQWGSRDTSENWGNNAWPFLIDFQTSIANDIANRAFEMYEITGAIQCARGIAEYSMQWATPDEQKKFDASFNEIVSYAGNIDRTMKRRGGWNDAIFTNVWSTLKNQFHQVPKFSVRTDIEAVTDIKPIRTGVYVCQDDPYGTLQFAWRGNGNGALYECQTFNDDGIKIIKRAGRRAIWKNNQKMFEIAKSADFSNKVEQKLKSYGIADPTPELMGAMLSDLAFKERSCKWYFVEMINGEFEDIEVSDDNGIADLSQNHHRIEGGQPCPQTGYWFTPSQLNSRRHFKEGEIMPALGSNYGATIWQWDSDQN